MAARMHSESDFSSQCIERMMCARCTCNSISMCAYKDAATRRYQMHLRHASSCCNTVRNSSRFQQTCRNRNGK